MFTSADKAIVAIIMAILFLAQAWFHLSVPGWLNEGTVQTMIGLLMPILVYYVPNKAPPPK